MKEIINQIIKDRHSTWPVNFDPVKKIDNALITEILDLAVWAPSHGLTQPWKFIVFHDNGIRKFFEKQQEIYLEITSADKVKAGKIQKLVDKISQSNGKDLAPGSPEEPEAVDVDALAWLIHTSAGDVNFKSALENANAATLQAALADESLVKTKRTKLEAMLRKREPA